MSYVLSPTTVHLPPLAIPPRHRERHRRRHAPRSRRATPRRRRGAVMRHMALHEMARREGGAEG